MSKRRILGHASAGLFAFALGLLGFGIAYFIPLQDCTRGQCWYKSNRFVTLRLREELTWQAQYRYEFESRIGQESWKQLFVHIQDDPVSNPADHMQVITETVATAYMGNSLWMTWDGGESWRHFDVDRDTTFGRANPSEAWIDTVTLVSNGDGSIKLWNPENRQDIPTLVTTDFGRRWVEMDVKR